MSNEKINDLVQRIFDRYEEEKASKEVGAILQKISQGSSYKEIYEFARSIGIGDIFKQVLTAEEFVMDMEEYSEISKGFMSVIRKYSEDINDLAELTQKGINEALGINIKPQRVKFQNDQIQRIVDALIDGIPLDSEAPLKIDGVNDELLKYSSELTDSIIKANAEIQSKSGFNIVVVRRYDDVGIHDYSKYADAPHRKTLRAARVCQFCKEREGTYDYKEVEYHGAKVWQRHKGCTCSIDFVNNGMTERVKNYVR